MQHAVYLVEEARRFTDFSSHLSGRVYRAHGLCNYGSGNVEEASRQLSEAVQQALGSFIDPADFAGQLSSCIQST